METCLVGLQTSSWFPEVIDDGPGTIHLLRFCLEIIV